MCWWDEERFGDNDSVATDPLLIERSKPVTEEEARRFEEICRAATPGPLVVDDNSDGDGVVFAYLADGRTIVCRIEGPAPWLDPAEAAAANAELVCRARTMVLRLLRDRQALAAAGAGAGETHRVS